MTECKQEVFEFQVHGSRKVTGDFTGGYLSSDGGAVFLRGVDLKMGLIERLAGCFCDYRLPCLVEHQVSELLRQRIGALALGYEDLNDHDRLRLDPLHALSGQSRRSRRRPTLGRGQGQGAGGPLDLEPA